GQRVIEEHDGSDNLLKQYVWGLGYVDEAVQTAINSDPTNSSHQTCDQAYWLCQDANYNVLGVVDSTGVLQERYEYSAYGQRQVFVSAGANDSGCFAPAGLSTRVVAYRYGAMPYGINDFGHQGLMHDEEDGLVYNRARAINPALGKFMSKEPSGALFVDGMNLYSMELENVINKLDPTGLATVNGEPADPVSLSYEFADLSGASSFTGWEGWSYWLASKGAYIKSYSHITDFISSKDQLLASMRHHIASRCDRTKCIETIVLSSHASPGDLDLGFTEISTTNFSRPKNDPVRQEMEGVLDAIGNLLCDKATIYLYGCSVGKGAGGDTLMQSLIAYYKTQGKDVTIIANTEPGQWGWTGFSGGPTKTAN
ncbi:MAG TPA: RHS repeat-associated core domain-containing protein, partial [Phycisphaerae bacterium]|nr:RHS repeat-associated core domain-containing protein [Phycisphaerae bacterium]